MQKEPDKEKKLNNLDAFLQKFKNIIPRDTLIKESLQSVLKEIVEIDIDKKDIKVNKKNIFIQCSPLVKQEIGLKKDMILQNLAKVIGENKIENII